MDDDPFLLVLLAAFAVVFILFLSDMGSTLPGCPVGMIEKRNTNRVDCTRPRVVVRRRVPCSIVTAGPNGWPLDYDDVAFEERRYCDRQQFPYCHALPVPFFRSLADDYFDVWPDYGCERDLVPDDYPEGLCGPYADPFPCAPTPLAPLNH